jgi:hypothetical protein
MGALLDSRGCPPKMHAKAGHDEAARALSAWPLFASTGWNRACHNDQHILHSLYLCPSTYTKVLASYIQPTIFAVSQSAAPPLPKRAPRHLLVRHLQPSYHGLIAAPPTNTSRLPGLFLCYIIRCTPSTSTRDILHILQPWVNRKSSFLAAL